MHSHLIAMTSANENRTIDEGTRDWAHSVQSRNADYVMGKVARQLGSGPMKPESRELLVKAAIEGGIAPSVAEAMFNQSPTEKLGEFDEPESRRSNTVFIEMLTKTMEGATMSTGGRELLAWSLATGQINALCAANTWDPTYYHIFVDPDLNIFCNAIGKLFAECFARNDAVTGDKLDLILVETNARSNELQNRAYDLFASIVVKGTSRGSRPWHPSPEAYIYAHQLMMALNMFPLAHELGHLNLGHIEAPSTQERTIAGHGDFLVYGHEDEFHADLIGAIVTIETLKRLKLSAMMSLLAPYIFLKGIVMLDTCFEVFGANAGEMSFTHPSATDRAGKMRVAIGYYLGRGKSVPPLYAKALLTVDRIFQLFLEGTIMNLRRLHAQGLTPRERIRLTKAEYDERMEAKWRAQTGE